MWFWVPNICTSQQAVFHVFSYPSRKWLKSPMNSFQFNVLNSHIPESNSDFYERHTL
jgi:hypothetical protein